MTKFEFLARLNKELTGIPQCDIEERLSFYSEMIDDRIEEGLSEDAAVSEMGCVKEIAEQIVAETPLSKIAKERIKPKRQLKTWEVVLIALGSPIWFSLTVAVISMVFSLYIALWSIIISLWAVFASLAACAVGCIVAGIVFSFLGNGLVGFAVPGVGIFCAGLSIFMFFGCTAATNGILRATRKIASGIKALFMKKETE